MRETLLELLACPLCRSDQLKLEVRERDAREIREGKMICQNCRAEIPIQKGVVQALLNPASTVAREAKGWVEMLAIPEKAHEFKDEWILSLPFIRPEQTPEQDSVRIWNQVGQHFFENLDRFDWRGKRVLEIGAGRCWAVAELARRGAVTTGLDILSYKYLGLETADVWFAANPNLYFERVVGDMHQLPFQSSVFDFVVTTSSLHHTDRLVTALQEIARTIQPNGHAFFINEPVIAHEHAVDMSDSAEVQHGIIEARPTYAEWVSAFNAAGLFVKDVRFQDDMHVLLSKRELHSHAYWWLRERMRRAPSAPRYYLGKAKQLLVKKR